MVFALSNRQVVELRFLLFESFFEIPLYIFFFITIFIGILMGSMVAIMREIKLRIALKDKDKKIKALNNEIATLKIQIKVSDQTLMIDDE